jgi:RNA polymerase sigma-70 factor, ECF subfamily
MTSAGGHWALTCFILLDSLRHVTTDSISSARAFEIARAAWPEIDLPRETFIAFADARAAGWQGNPERAADLYLACACIERIPAAVAEFMSSFGERIPQYLKRLARNPDMVAEVRQVLITRCIIGDEGHPPALVTYSATGSLEGWLRATAVREALALNRHSDRNGGDVEAALEARMPWVDREISLFKQIYREPVSRAFAGACAKLTAQDRALLRLHYVDGVTTAGLATMYGISRATLIRRLATAREALVDAVKTELRSAAGVADKDFDSVLRLVHSQIDLRLSMMLQPTD